MLAALGELMSERSGVLNVGLEGIMIFGAFAAIAAAAGTGDPVIGAAAAGATGVVAALALGIATVVLRADQIVAGIGFNILAFGLTSFLRYEILGGQVRPVSRGILGPLPLPGLAQIPWLGTAFFKQSPMIYFAILTSVALWFVLRRTLAGLTIRAAGEGAAAADSAGVSVVKVRLVVLAFTGFMTGLGGAYLSLIAGGGVFVDNMTAGRGYLAIAVAIFSRWHPVWAVVIALLFGLADALQYQGQTLGFAIPSPILLMSPFVLALVTWVVLGQSAAAPADLGRPFLRGAR